VTGTGTVTNNIATAGPIVNGRDQSGAFSAASWVHFWWIYNGMTIATLSSASATAPTLPSGYTSLGYIGAVRLNGSSQLVPSKLRGTTVYYDAAQAALTNGSATTPTSVNVATLVPPNALTFTINIVRMNAISTGGGDLLIELNIQHTSGSTFQKARFMVNGVNTSSNESIGGPSITLPNVGQAFLYDWDITTGSSPQADITVMAYSVPNGGE
jgi:hypothetical protein